MRRIIFSFFEYEISSYSFFAVLAFVVSVIGFYLFARHRGYARRDLFILIPLLAVAAFAGARLLHIATNLGLYHMEPWRVWRFGFSGFSIYGGIVSVLLVGVIFARIRRLSVWHLGDTAAPILGLSIATMRVGCYLNGCCFGHATDLPWGATFPFMSQAHSHQLSLDPGHLFYVSPVHPTQLYELGYALIGGLLAVLIIRWQNKNNAVIASPTGAKQSRPVPSRRIPEGTAILAFGLIYTIGRLANLRFRVMPPTLDAPGWFYPGLYIGMIVLISGLLVWRIGLTRRKENS